MSREPTAIVFPDSPGNARVESSADPVSKPADSSPRAVVFNDFAASPATSPPPVRLTPDSGPRPLVFPDTPKAPSTNASKPPAPAAKLSAKVVPAGADVAGPKALSFPVTTAIPPARAPGEVTFAAKAHPLQADIVAKACQLSPDVAHAQISRLERMVASLLPLRLEALQDYADKRLALCREHALLAARVTKRHMMLDGADLLERALASATPALGLRQRLAQKFQQVAGETPESWVVKLNALRRELVDILKEVRTAHPDARSDAEKMALALLALRSTAEVCGTPPDRNLAFALDQRLETLRVALTQATLAPAQLQATETTAALQLVEIDRLINVTFSAVALANGKRTTHP